MLGDRYRLEELVGQGGMGRVYRATDELLGRTVAIKIFPAAVNSEADRARRASETRLLASLSHGSLVTLYDAVTLDNGSGYLVMEYVDGGTLADCIARGPMAPHHVAHIAVDLGEALHAVHSVGVIHRDIKPPNVLLRSALGRPFHAMLADFGIAYLVDSARMTTPGMAVGTAAYFSPEQARGAQPSPASDIYAFGLVLIEALTGRRAFPQTTPIEAAVARLHQPPEVPATFGYGWRSLLTAMTAVDPAERPSALEVADRARALVTDAAHDDLPETTEAALPLPAPTIAAPLFADEPTHVVPLAQQSLRPRHRRSRRRPGMRTGLAIAGAAAAVLGAHMWVGAAFTGPDGETDARLLERTAIERIAPTPLAEPVDAEIAVPEQPVSEPIVEQATTQQTSPQQTATQDGATQPASQQTSPQQPATQNQAPVGSSSKDKGSKGADKAHGNGNGNGRSGVGTPDNGRGNG
ncbi:serine/threonine-protein kinase [Microbacterium sp. JZ31]|uniref:serine/threonine-protein kinase n=1 Tax=Microbacterium sp. JZ31 TaxID=1906274 RepID=UPI001EE451AD|nr:serine/threonine-protein kinase [Microbacterium sp. JZ31]